MRRKAITINGPGYAPTNYQDCLFWWKRALERKIHVPLTLPAAFPKPGAPGYALRYLRTRHARRALGAELMSVVQFDPRLFGK